jgi:hypothetical protein
MGTRAQSCLPGDLSRFQLTLENRFPPVLNKIEGKTNMKSQVLEDMVRYFGFPPLSFSRGSDFSPRQPVIQG